MPGQIANHTGYISVDWKRVERDVNKAKKQLKLNVDKPSKEVKTKVQEVWMDLSFIHLKLVGYFSIFMYKMVTVVFYPHSVVLFFSIGSDLCAEQHYSDGRVCWRISDWIGIVAL